MNRKKRVVRYRNKISTYSDWQVWHAKGRNKKRKTRTILKELRMQYPEYHFEAGR